MGVISLDLQQTDAGANKWSYNWLTDLPSINGVTIQGDLTLEDLDIIIPTKVSELENDAGYVTEEDLTDRFYTKDEVYNKDEIDDKFDDIVIPTKVSELENDAGYITDAALTPYYTSAQVDSLVEAEAAQRLNADTALANRLTTAETNITANATAISNEATARQNADNDLSSRIAANTSAIATNTANITTNTTNIATNTANIATNTANIATNASAIAQNTSDIATNAANIATNTANIATNTANIATNASDIAGETDAREIADQNLQEQIDAIAASSDVVDIVGTYAALQAYDTSKLHDNDIIKVLDDETRNDATTYYRWAVSTSTWSYIGAEGPFYTKADADATFVPQTRTINSKALSSNITLTAQDVGALPDSTVIPTVNNATLTIQKNGSTVQTFTANSSTNKTANITVPTKTSDLTNDGDGDSNFATETYVDTYGGKIDVIKVNGTAQTITNKTVDISVPTKTSDITNDSGYITSSSLPTKTSDLTNDGSDGTSTYVEADDLATVATSGSYNDLSNKPTIPNPKDYYWANVKVSDTSATNTTPTFARSTYTGTGYPHLQGNGNGLMLAATGGWTARTGALVLETASLRPSSVESGNMDLGKSDSLWKNLYLSGDIYKGTYKLTLPSKTGTVALTSDIPGVFTGAGASTAGTSGIVPAPAAGDNTKFLSGDGTWKTVSQYELPIASANTLGGVKIGENLSITNTGVLSADAQQIDVDSAMSTTSENPVQNKVITEALAGKTNTKRSYTTATTLNYKKITVVGGAYSTDGSGIILFTREERYIIDGMCASGYGGKCIELGTNHNASNTSATTSNRWVNIKVYGVPESRTTEIYCRMSPYTYVDVHSSGTITITDINESTWTAATNNATYIPLLGTDTALSTTSVAPVQNKVVTTALNSKADTSSLATVATSGSYNDLSNKPTIPTVNNATLTIQKNGSTVKTFTANASSNVTANITVPTATSELTNDSGFIDEIPVASAGTLGGVKVGSNLSIDASGVLSASTSGSITKASGGTLGTTTINSTTANYMEVTKLSTATDLNTIKTTGIYIIAATPTNSPTGAWGTMYVDWTAGAKYQVYINDGVSGNIFKRSWDSSNSTWTSWIRITSADIANIERFYRGLVPLGTAIAANKDLNTTEFLKVGKYYCSTNATVATLTNCPTGTAFMMEVFSPLSTTIDNETTGTWVYRTRVITELDGDTWYQGCNSDSTANNWTYGTWYKVARTADIGNATLTIQKNGTNVQTFTANATSNATANITVPTKISDLTNTSGGFITYCTCTSAADATTKTITVDSGDSNWTLRKGTVIAVRFTNTNTASNVKFDVGGSGAKSVYYNTAVNTGSSNSIFGYANRTVLYVYDGTNWVWLSDSRHDGNDNTYTTAYCSTAAGTAAKAATMTGYVLTANRYTVITFTNANSYAGALTLNINGKGAKPLYINGAASSSSNYTLAAGSYIVYYDGTNYHIYNNGEIPRMIHSDNPSSVVAPSSTVPGSSIADGTITFAKTATGEFLKLQLSTVDIGEGASLAPNTLYGVYE